MAAAAAAAGTVMVRPSTTYAFSAILVRASRLYHSSHTACFHHRLLCTGKRLPLGAASRLPHVTGRGRRGGGGGGVGEVVLSVQRRLGGVRAAQVNDPGSIDSSMMQSMENKIREELTSDIVTVKDAYGDGRHVSIYVVSSAFEGQSSVNRQRMVYKAIWEELQSTVHAVDQMVTQTPAEAEK